MAPMPVTLPTPSPPPPRLFSLYPAGKPQPRTVLPTRLLQACSTSWCGVAPHSDTTAPAVGRCSPRRPASPRLASALRSAVSSNLWCPLMCLRDDPAGLFHRENRPASRQVWPSAPAARPPLPPITVTQRLCPSCPLPTSGCLLLMPQPHLSLSRILTIRIKLSLFHLKTLKQNLTRRVYAAKGCPGFSCPMPNSPHSSTAASTPASCASLLCFLFVSMAEQCSGGQPVIPRSGSALGTRGGSLWVPPGGAAHTQLKTTSGRSCATRGSGITGASDPVWSHGVK